MTHDRMGGGRGGGDTKGGVVAAHGSKQVCGEYSDEQRQGRHPLLMTE